MQIGSVSMFFFEITHYKNSQNHLFLTRDLLLTVLSEIYFILDNHHTIFKLQINRMFHCLSSSLKTRPLLKTLDEKYEEATFAVLSYLLSQVCHPSLDHNKFRFSTGPGNRCWSELKSLKWLLGRL